MFIAENYVNCLILTPFKYFVYAINRVKRCHIEIYFKLNSPEYLFLQNYLVRVVALLLEVNIPMSARILHLER